MKPSRVVLVAVALLALAARAGAQTRPLQAEEALTAAAGTLVLEAGGALMRAEPNFLTGSPRDVWAAPLLRLTWSPADTVEMDVAWTGRLGARSDPRFGTVSDFGDVELGAKARLGGGARSAVAARLTVTLPQTRFGNGLGPNTLRMSAQLLFTRTTGATALHLGAGLALHDEPLRAHEQRDFLAYSAAITRRLIAPVELVAEMAGLAGRGMPGADPRHEARAGFRVGSPSLRVDAAVRRGLAEADGTWGATAGLTLRVDGGR